MLLTLGRFGKKVFIRKNIKMVLLSLLMGFISRFIK